LPSPVLMAERLDGGPRRRFLRLAQGQRLTVLHCAISWTRRIGAISSRCSRSIRYDGLLAWFGYPEASEFGPTGRCSCTTALYRSHPPLVTPQQLQTQTDAYGKRFLDQTFHTGRRSKTRQRGSKPPPLRRARGGVGGGRGRNAMGMWPHDAHDADII
jgi:hypothetical protein